MREASGDNLPTSGGASALKAEASEQAHDLPAEALGWMRTLWEQSPFATATPSSAPDDMLLPAAVANAQLPGRGAGGRSCSKHGQKQLQSSSCNETAKGIGRHATRAARNPSDLTEALARRRVLRSLAAAKPPPPVFRHTSPHEAAASGAAAAVLVAATRTGRGWEANSAPSRPFDTRGLRSTPDVDPFWHLGRTGARPKYRPQGDVRSSATPPSSPPSEVSPFLRDVTSDGAAADTGETAAEARPLDSARRSGRNSARQRSSSSNCAAGTPRSRSGIQQTGTAKVSAGPKPAGDGRNTTLTSLSIRSGRPASAPQSARSCGAQSARIYARTRADPDTRVSSETTFKTAAAAEVLRRVKHIRAREQQPAGGRGNARAFDGRARRAAPGSDKLLQERDVALAEAKATRAYAERVMKHKEEALYEAASQALQRRHANIHIERVEVDTALSLQRLQRAGRRAQPEREQGHSGSPAGGSSDVDERLSAALEVLKDLPPEMLQDLVKDGDEPGVAVGDGEDRGEDVSA